LREVITRSPANDQDRREKIENEGLEFHRVGLSAVFRVEFAVFGDLRFVAVTVGQQHRLGVVEVATRFPVVLVDPCLDDRVDRAGLFAETAKDALGQSMS
jgi:hypothetical protein